MNQHSRRHNSVLVPFFTIALQLFIAETTKADDGYRLWLRYDPLPPAMISVYRPRISSVVVSGHSATLDVLRAELVNGASGLLGGPVPVAADASQEGAIVAGTAESSRLIRS